MPSQYKNLILLGTSHISKQSIEDIKRIIEKEKPKIIALELDYIRFNSLLKKKKRRLKIKDIKQIGITGFLFNIIGAWSSKKLGKLVGVSPGSEMLTAIKIAKKEKINIVLIDRDIRITLKRLSRFITWKEKMKFILELFKISKNKKEIKKLDLTKVPNKFIIKRLTNELKKKYPSAYRVLIYERNIIMAKNLNKLMNTSNKKILAIVGAGHEEEMIKLIKNEKVI
jgi:pheromone shutdown-related protein TraB